MVDERDEQPVLVRRGIGVSWLAWCFVRMHEVDILILRRFQND